MQSFVTSDNNSTCKTNASREIVQQEGLLTLQHRSYREFYNLGQISLNQKLQTHTKPNQQNTESKSIKTRCNSPPPLSTSVKKVTNNMSSEMQNWVHSVASPEELSEVISSLEVTGFSSSSVASDLPSGIITWG